MKNSKKILLVEDEPIIAMLEKQQLESISYSITHVMNGEDAIQQVIGKDINFDLILMDIDLGSGIDGTQAAEEILKEKDIPIVFLSSHTESEIVEKTEKITSYGYVVKNSGVVVLDASIKMAFKLFEAKMSQNQKEEELKKSEHKYRMLFENMNVSFGLHEAIYDNNGNTVDFRYIDMNPKFLNNLGSTASAIRGHTAKELFPNTEQYWIDTFGEVAKTGISVSFQNYSRELDQWFNTFVFSPQKNYFASFFIDITEQKRAEEALKESENRFRHLMNNMPGTAWIVDKEFKFTLSQGAGLEKIGLKPDQVVGMTLYEFFDTNDKNHIVIYNHQCALNGDIVQYEQTYNNITFNTSLSPLYDENGCIIGVTGLSLDISDRKQAEDEIQKQLSDKEILLREVHHRVKNNISNIANLLSLQAGSTNNLEVSAALNDAVSRVQSMRILYDKLLLSKDIHKISIKTYIEDLADSLHDIFVDKDNIIIEKHISDFNIISKQATPIGIIINELLTNVFKYAFKDRDKGTVSVSIEKTENMVTIIIQDNGIGIDGRILENKSPGFGLTIVKMLVEQLEGTYSMVNDNGTKSVIKFER